MKSGLLFESALLVDRLNHLVKGYGVFLHKLGNNVLRNVSRDCNFVFFSINSGRDLVTKESRGARVVDVLELTMVSTFSCLIGYSDRFQ